MSVINDNSHNLHLLKDNALSILEQAGLFYSIKNANLEYIAASDQFAKSFGLLDVLRTDFDVFIPEIAYEISHEDNLVLTSQVPSEVNRVLITRSKAEYVVNVMRKVIVVDGESLLITFYKDITTESQNKQFEAYKGVLTESEVFEKMLNRFSNIIFNSSHSKDIFLGVGSLIIDLLDLQDFSIFLYDSKNQVLEQVFELNDIDGCRYFDKGDHLTLGIDKGVIGLATKRKKSIIVDDVSLEPAHVPGHQTTKSEIAVPIIYKGEVLGVIDSESSQYARYNDRIKKTLEGIASLLGIKLRELQNQKALMDSNRQLSSLVKSNPYPVAVLDSNNNYIAVSDEWKAQYGKRNRDLIGRNHFDVNPNIPLRWKKMIQNAQHGEGQELKKESYKRKNGQVEFYSAKINPWYSSQEIGGVVIVAENITAKVNKEVKLSQNEKELELAHKYGKLFKWEADLETGEFSWSSGSYDIPHFPSHKKHGLDTVFELIDKSYHADFNQAIEKAIEDKGSFSLIHPFTMGGHKSWLHNRGEVIVNKKDGSVIKIKGTSQDITSQIDAELAYQQQNTELKKINQELDQFVYKTAHDLRAPLTNLIGLISIMKNESNPELLKSYFDLQEKSVEKLDSFIKQITEHTKNSRLEVQNSEVDFGSVVDEVLSEYYYVPNSDKIKKVVEIESGVIFYSDNERVKIILSNLISNALKYADLSKKDPTMHIKIGIVSDKIHICVRDNGEGIVEERKSKVFDMFYRASKQADGSGIGLYIVKQTVDKLYGQIMLSTELGKFTQFDVFLPYTKSYKQI